MSTWTGGRQEWTEETAERRGREAERRSHRGSRTHGRRTWHCEMSEREGCWTTTERRRLATSATWGAETTTGHTSRMAAMHWMMTRGAEMSRAGWATECTES